VQTKKLSLSGQMTRQVLSLEDISPFRQKLLLFCVTKQLVVQRLCHKYGPSMISLIVFHRLAIRPSFGTFYVDHAVIENP
jgi:hypothetical protein